MIKKIAIACLALFATYILSPYLAAVGMGAIFAVLFYPWMKRIDRGRFPNSLAAGLFTTGVTLLIFVPVIAIMIGSVNTGLNELKRIKRMNPASTEAASSEVVLDKMFASSGFESFLERTSRVLPIDPVQASEHIKDIIINLTGRLGGVLSAFIGSIPNMLIEFVVFLFALYYFLADGMLFLQGIKKNSVFNSADTQSLFVTFSGLCRSVLVASVITGGIQALLAMITCFALGIHQSILVFPIVLVASFVPLIGSFPIMMGMSFYQFIAGNTVAAVVLLAAGFFIGTVDNFIRPQIIRGGSNLHPLLSFVSALGGLQIFGMSGLFLGPVICGLAVEAIKIIQRDASPAAG